MAGTYGEKKSFEDAKVAAPEFLDDFYNEDADSYNQAFCTLDLRIQEYYRVRAARYRGEQLP